MGVLSNFLCCLLRLVPAIFIYLFLFQAGGVIPVTVLFLLYCGEEQGLYGSNVHAQSLVTSGNATKVKVTATICFSSYLYLPFFLLFSLLLVLLFPFPQLFPSLFLPQLAHTMDMVGFILPSSSTYRVLVESSLNFQSFFQMYASAAASFSQVSCKYARKIVCYLFFGLLSFFRYCLSLSFFLSCFFSLHSSVM